jgi:Zn-dependent peptidase ImmA (M78 family)
MTIDLDDFPDLSADQIEEEAGFLTTSYFGSLGQQVSVPVPVEQIAERYLGYSIELTDEGLFADPTYLGGIVFESNTILVNGSVEEHEGRYNFTIAHELGHHALHRDLVQSRGQSVVDGEPTVICRDTTTKPKAEQQADRFAAALLMPKAVVMREFYKLFKEPVQLSQKDPKKARGIAAKLVTAAGLTNVSNTALVNRLLDLGLLYGVHYQTGTSTDFYRKGGYRKGGYSSKYLKKNFKMLVRIATERLKFLLKK